MTTRFPITLNQLSYFAACARTLNMTAASEELHVAQSAVSTAITQLERSLGATLFIRIHAKGLVLTDAGEQLQRETQRLFEGLENIIESVREGESAIRGVVRIAVFSTFVPTLLPAIISRLEEVHPELGLEVLEGDHAQNLADLRSGRADMALTYTFSLAQDVTARAITEAMPYVLVSEHHPLATEGKVALRQLSGEAFIMLDLPDSREYFLDLARKCGAQVQVRHRSENFEAVRAMVAAGMGVSILNQRPVYDTTYSGARAVPLDISDDVQGLPIAIVRLRQLQPSAKIRAMAKVVEEVLRTA